MFYQYQGVKVHYEVYGSGSKTILILPGWGETKMTFSTMVHALSSTGKYQIYLIDYPGFGKSPSREFISFEIRNLWKPLKNGYFFVKFYIYILRTIRTTQYNVLVR